MNDELTEYLSSKLGLQPKTTIPGMDRAIDAFLGKHFNQKRPIQAQAVDVIYAGKDVLMISATASGKTEAAIIPVSAKLLAHPDHVALYVAPTRALLNDLNNRLLAPMHQLGLDIRVKHGDVSLPGNKSSIRILLTTPESLDILLYKYEALLRKVNYVILDEIHQLYGNPRGDQLIFILQRLEKFTGRLVQRIALSATIGNPEDVSRWLCPKRDSAQIIISQEKKEIVAEFRWLSQLNQLREFIVKSKSKKVLCFENSRKSCDDLFLVLKDLDPYRTFIHYSTLTKEQRQYVESGFKSSPLAICVATSTLELGIDIGSIEKVIIAEPSLSVNSFMQRIGRGGRRAADTQVMLLSKNKMELLRNLALLQLSEAGRLESQSASKPFSVLIQQIFSILAGSRKLLIHSNLLFELFEDLEWLEKDSLKEILEKLVEESFLRRESLLLFGVGPKLEQLIEDKAIFSNISGSDSGIPIFHEGRLLANIPIRQYQAKHGNVILFAGRYWRITGISNAGLTVQVSKPVPDPVRPGWGNKGSFNTSYLLAQGMRNNLLHKPSIGNSLFDETCQKELKEIFASIPNLSGNQDVLLYKKSVDDYIYFTFAGSIGNQILRLIFENSGVPCRSVPNADGIALVSNAPIELECIPSTIPEFDSLLQSHWRQLSSLTSVGPFFDYLPTSLKRAEVLSRAVNSSLLESLIHYREMSPLLTSINIL